MRLFGLDITRAKAAPGQQAWTSSSGGWWPIVREPFTGAWQRNLEERADTLIAYHAVYACITLIASDVAKCRLRLVEENPDRVWTETFSAAFSPVLEKPNNYQTRIQFIESWMTSKLINGNTYVLKERDERRVVNALYVLDPTRIKVLVAPDGQVYYELSADNLAGVRDAVTVPSSEMIHDMTTVRFHPLCGLAPMAPASLAATHGLDIQRSAISLFRNSGRPGGFLSTPGKIKKEDAERLKAQWEQNYTGANTGKLAVVDNDLKFYPMEQAAKDAQLIEQLGLSGKMVCSAFQVPPHMAGIGEMPSYNNIEQLQLQYLTGCLQKHIEAIELCLDEGLGLTGVPGRRYGTEFDLDDLLRMDTATLVKSEAEAVRGGIKAPNEARRRLNLGPVKGGETPYLQHQDYSLAALAKRDASDDPFGTAAPQPAPALPEPNEEEEEEKSLSDIDIEHITKSHFESAGVIPFGLLAYNPNQPRDPGGEGGGQWVPAGGGDDDGAAPDGVADPHKPVDPGKDSALLTPEEQASITYYQGEDGFSKINNSLRAGNSPGEHAKRLSSAIAKHRLIEDTTVYRGIGNTLSKKLSDLWRDREGSADITFTDKGFVSTSMSQKVAETFSKNTVKIKLPKGHNVLPIVDRELAHEAEILLDKGAKFKVTNMRKTASGYRRFDVEIAA